MGKTALALQWAHQVARRFPDGQLYVNLRGYDPGLPVPPAEALAGFLRSLGMPARDIPPGEDERAVRYRSLLASRRMLVVLDNAGSADQVRPLLPGVPTAAVVITSRDALAGLVAREGAVRLDLDVLSLEESIELLRALIGAHAPAEPGAAAELARQCCRIPLALRVAAELAAARPAVPLSLLTGELADLRARLDLLDVGDSRSQVRTVFSWSYRHLRPGDARSFRLLSLHPGPTLEPYAVAALTDVTLKQARRALDMLAHAHLIQAASLPGRYAMHDLLRGYALELTAAQDGGQEERAALTRLFDHYLYTAAAAMDTLFPAERRRRPRIPRPSTPVPLLADAAVAREWLDGERAAFTAVVGYAAGHGWPGHTTRLAVTLSRYLRNGGHFPEDLLISRHALFAARSAGDRAAEANALDELANVDFKQGRFRQAPDRYRRALALFRAAGDQAGQARVLANLASVEIELRHYAQAADYQQESAAIWREFGDRLGESRVLGGLALTRLYQGRYQDAADCNRQSLDLARGIGDRQGEAWALSGLGNIELRRGDFQRAVGYLRQALDLFRSIGDTTDECETVSKLGAGYLGLGQYEEAAQNFGRALARSREIGNQFIEAVALNGLGDVLLRTNKSEMARAHHAAAFWLASEPDAPIEQA